ncbi:MAG: TonB-dependent receptor [Burkholderiaceae bacterium]
MNSSTAFLMMACALASPDSRAQNPSEVLELPQVEVVGTTPLPGSGVQLRKLPANAQIFTSDELRQQRAGNLTEFLDQNATGINVNAAQGNPFQPDVTFRGFSASPLLGTPQGISVFFDGVRINEPFGDAVNWDLIPQSAISSIQLIPGSNPAFGLNTLGGAIALYSKSGASEYPQRPGGSVTLSGGSFGRRTLGFETGGKHGNWDWFVTGNDAVDGGWAEHNASHVRQLFAKVGWQDDLTDVDVTFGLADNRLDGAQTVPLSFTDIRQGYTYPDRNLNRAGFIAIKGSHALTDAWLLSADAYLRRLTNDNLSSNVNDEFDDDGVQAINDAAQIRQTNSGAAVQLTHTGNWAGKSNKMSFGASVDQGRARFTRTAQEAAFNAERGTVGIGDFEPETD